MQTLKRHLSKTKRVGDWWVSRVSASFFILQLQLHLRFLAIWKIAFAVHHRA